jgi:hypothetical protein
VEGKAGPDNGWLQVGFLQPTNDNSQSASGFAEKFVVK